MLLRKRRLAIGLLALAVVGIGCSKGWTGHHRWASTGLIREDRIAVILYERAGGEYSRGGLEEEVVECIQDALEDTHPTVQILPPDEFRQVAFPDVSAGKTPPGDWSWETLAAHPGFQKRIAPLGLRYLIAVEVSKSKGPTKGGVLGMGPGVGGFGMWDTRATLWAEVVDLTHARLVGRVWGTSEGKSAAGFFLIPFYYPSFPESLACDELGEGVAKFLAHKDPLFTARPHGFDEPWLGAFLRAGEGLLGVERVDPGGLAERINLHPGDELTRSDGIPVTDRGSLARAICARDDTGPRIITFQRGGQTRSVSFTLEDDPCRSATPPVPVASEEKEEVDESVYSPY